MSNPHLGELTSVGDGGTVLSLEDVFDTVAHRLGTVGVVQVSGTVTAWRPGKHGWVRAEIAILDTAGDATAKLGVAVRPGSRILGGPVKVGAEVVVTGTLVTHPLYSPLQLQTTQVQVIAKEADTTTALRGHLARLKAQGRLEANKQRGVPDPITRIGLITPASGGAGLNDPILILNTSPKPIRVEQHAVAMMGKAASQAIATAIVRAAIGNDVVLLCRGGGTTTDLAAFNSIEVIDAIINAAVSVVTGIGHAHDSTAADLVAHTSTATPTAAAAWVLAVNRRSQEQADQAALVIQQRQARQLAAAGHQQIAAAADIQTRADRRIRMVMMLAAIVVAMGMLAVLAVWILAS